MPEMIYLDNAATTPTDPRVFEAMRPYLEECYGNPSAICRPGAAAKAAVEKARSRIAALIGADPSEIYFTSGGTEADNWALTGAFELSKSGHPHIITTRIEHHAVLETCRYLEKRGARVTYLETDRSGFVDPEAVERAVNEDTCLISVMTANNEVGTVEPVSAVGAIAEKHGILFHTDAVQAYGHIPIDVNQMHISMLSASGHKLNGPKGIGFLYIRKGVRIGSFLHGGAQEHGRRAGTENVPGIVGLGAAAALASGKMEEEMRKTAAVRDELARRLLGAIPGSYVAGPSIGGAASLPGISGTEEKRSGHASAPGSHVSGADAAGGDVSPARLPNNICLIIPGIEGESAVIALDLAGICVSSGSACSSGSTDPSHVLLALGIPYEEAAGAVRITIGPELTEEETERTVAVLKKTAERLRR